MKEDSIERKIIKRTDMEMEPRDGQLFDEWVVVLREEGSENPRVEYDVLSVFWFNHDRYLIGDIDAERTFQRELGITSTDTVEVIERHLKKKGAEWTRVYFYDHGELKISSHPFTCPLDSGMLGFAAIFAPDIRDIYNCKRITQKTRRFARNVLDGELTQYNQWMTGDVWGYKHYKRDMDGDPIEMDSCWGFYGNDVTDNGMAEYLPEDVPLFTEEGELWSYTSEKWKSEDWKRAKKANVIRKRYDGTGANA